MESIQNDQQNELFYINNKYRTAHLVGHSKLTPLDIVGFYERKQTNENMENEMK